MRRVRGLAQIFPSWEQARPGTVGAYAVGIGSLEELLLHVAVLAEEAYRWRRKG